MQSCLHVTCATVLSWLFTDTRDGISVFFCRLLSQFLTDFHEILQGDYPKILIGKYSIAKKLDHLACNAIQG